MSEIFGSNYELQQNSWEISKSELDIDEINISQEELRNSLNINSILEKIDEICFLTQDSEEDLRDIMSILSNDEISKLKEKGGFDLLKALLEIQWNEFSQEDIFTEEMQKELEELKSSEGGGFMKTKKIQNLENSKAKFYWIISSCKISYFKQQNTWENKIVEELINEVSTINSSIVLQRDENILNEDSLEASDNSNEEKEIKLPSLLLELGENLSVLDDPRLWKLLELLKDQKSSLEEIGFEISRNEDLIFQLLEEYDRENGTNKLSQFTNTVKEITKIYPSFIPFSVRLETKLIISKSKITRSSLVIWVSDLSNIEINSEWVIADTADWFQVKATENSREISLSWSDFTLWNPLENHSKISQIEQIEERANQNLENINQEKLALWKFLEYIQESVILWEDLDDIKLKLRQENPDKYMELWLEDMSNIDDIKSKIQKEYQKQEGKYQEILEWQNRETQQIIDETVREYEEDDRQTKETLKFLNSIHFDILPSETWKWLIDRVNREKWLFGLQEDIDLANWSFWFSAFWSWKNDLENKKNFAQLINILFTSEKDWFISIDSIWFGWMPTFLDGNWEKLEYWEAQMFLRQKLWMDPKGVIMWNIDRYSEEKND